LTHTALRPHLVDSLLHATLEPRDVVIRGDTVECSLIERNDAMRWVGLDSVVHYPRYVFKDGLVILKEARKPAPLMQELIHRWQPYWQWVGKAHPEAEAVLLDSLGRGRWDRAAGYCQMLWMRKSGVS
jgi:hypothetical protein